MKNKKIVIDIRMINHSGIGRYIKSTIPQIINKLSDVEFYLLVNELVISEKYFSDKVNFIRIDSKPYSLKEQFELLYKIPKNINLFWSPHYIFPILIKSKVLLTVHDIYHYNISANIFKNLYSRIIFYFIKIKKCQILSVSSFTKNQILQNINIKKANIKVVHNGLDKKLFNNIKSDKRDLLFCVSNIKTNKNISNLLKSYINISKNVEEDLYIAGNYKNIKNTDKEALKIAINNNRIHLLGNISTKEIVKFYNRCTLYIHPSIYEGFGLPPLEAMSCGALVLSSNFASLPEVLGDSVVYFNPLDINDMSNKIKDSIKNRAKILSNKKKYIKKTINLYSWDKTIDKSYNVICDLIK